MSEEDNDILIDAKLADAAYSQKPEVDGWARDTSLSNENRSVYTKGGKAKVAFTGTNFKKKRWVDDVGSDLLVGLGLQDYSSRMKNAKKTTDEAIKKYGAQNVSLTGHSLGGSQAAYVSRARGLKATGYNAAFSPIDLLRKRTYTNFKNVSTTTDPISMFGRRLSRMTHIKTKAKSANAHGLKANFI